MESMSSAIMNPHPPRGQHRQSVRRPRRDGILSTCHKLTRTTIPSCEAKSVSVAMWQRLLELVDVAEFGRPRMQDPSQQDALRRCEMAEDDRPVNDNPRSLHTKLWHTDDSMYHSSRAAPGRTHSPILVLVFDSDADQENSQPARCEYRLFGRR
jgi:hypothetical protein